MADEELPCEEWKAIPGYEGYEASNLGRIRSSGKWIVSRRFFPGRILRAFPYPSGHLITHLGAGLRKTKSVHQLVMLAFRGPCPEGKEIAHHDENPANNNLANLRYATRTENMADRVRNGVSSRGSRNGMCKLTLDAVREIRRGGKPIELAKKYGVSVSHVYRVRSGENWEWLDDDTPPRDL